MHGDMINWKIYVSLLYFCYFPDLYAPETAIRRDLSFFTLSSIENVLEEGRQQFFAKHVDDILRFEVTPYHSNLAVSYGKLNTENFMMMGYHSQVMLVTCQNILENHTAERPIDAKDFIYQLKHSGYFHVAERTDVRQISFELGPNRMAKELQSGCEKDLIKNRDITQNFGLQLQDFINFVSLGDAEDHISNNPILDINLLQLPASFYDNLKVHHLEFNIYREIYHALGFDINKIFINSTFYSIQFEPNEDAIDAMDPKSFQDAIMSMFTYMSDKDEN